MKDFTIDPVTTGSNDGSWCRRWKSRGTIFGLFIALMIFSLSDSLYAQTNIQGTAPVQDPNGGFGVDGDARANFPIPDVGDWFAYPGGSGGSIFPAEYSLPGADFEGVINFADEDMTYFFRDDISNNDPTIFIGSNKINDDPETYEWGAGSSPNKNEIQTAAAHFTYGDPALGGDADDLWVIFAADRQVTNGSSYIDFEFLQNSLTRTGTTSGTFVSEGPDMNRTVGDVLVTIEFTQGGDAANAVIRTWQPNGSGGYSYVLYEDYPAGTIFITNNVVETIVPWSVYFTDPIEGGENDGLYQYEINQWAEGAVNLSALFEQDECFNISTLFVRTRTSGSSGQSELKDFPGGPVQLELDLIPDISFEDPDPVCSPETVDLTLIEVEGCDEGTLSYWMDEDAMVEVDNPEAVGAGTYYIQCASNVNPICVDIEPVTVVVNPLPTATAGNGGPVCYDEESVALSESGGDAVEWAWSSDGAAVFSDASAQNPTVTGFVDGEIFTVQVTDANGCVSSDTTTLTVYPEPTAVAENSGPVCYDATSVTLDETGGDAVEWAWSSDGAAVFSDASAQSPTVTGFVDGEVFTVMITDGNGCTSSDSTTLSVYMEPTAVAENSGPVCYDEQSVTLNETGGDAVEWAWSSDGSAVFSDASAQSPTVTGFADGEIFTVNITDANGCTSSDTTTVTVYPEPTASADNGGPVCYDEASVSLSESGGDAVEWAWSSDGSAVFSDASVQNPTVTGFADGEIFTVVITDENGCTSSDTTTLTVYPEPSCSASNSGPVCAGDDVMLYETGGDAVSWLWSSNGAATFNDNTLQNPTASGAVDGEIFTVMVTDANGCTSTCTTTVTVEICEQEACTLGYWKEHTDRWECYSTCTLYEDVFGIDFADYDSNYTDLTLLEALNLGGGGIYNLARQSVAALLNMCHDDISYPYTGDLIQDVYDAFVGGYAGQLASELDMINNSYDCPMFGTPATTAPSPECVNGAASEFDASAGISVSPVPFKDHLNIKYEFNYESYADIQIFDVRGNLVKSYRESNAGFGKVTTINADFVRGEQMYIIKVTTNQGTYTKNVVSGKQ